MLLNLEAGKIMDEYLKDTLSHGRAQYTVATTKIEFFIQALNVFITGLLSTVFWILMCSYVLCIRMFHIISFIYTIMKNEFHFLHN